MLMMMTAKDRRENPNTEPLSYVLGRLNNVIIEIEEMREIGVELVRTQRDFIRNEIIVVTESKLDEIQKERDDEIDEIEKNETNEMKLKGKSGFRLNKEILKVLPFYASRPWLNNDDLVKDIEEYAKTRIIGINKE